MKKYIYIIIILNFLIINLSAQDLTVRATVNASTIGIGDQIRYSISASGAGQIPQPKLPALPQFKVYNAGTSSSFQFVNGQISSSVTYNYSLVPIKTGTFTIGAAQITHNGKIYQSQPITITVTKASKKKKKQRQTTIEERFYNQTKKGELFIKAIVNKSKVYINEPVLFSYKLYYKNVAVTAVNYKKPPIFSGFWAEDIPPEKVRKRKVEILNGTQYYTIIIDRKVLFPNSPGKKYISKNSMVFKIEDFFSVFGRNVERTSNPVSINVISLPSKNKPSSFNGTVGNYSIKTKLSTKKFIQNEPFSLKIIISGTGNIKSISDPKAPDFNNFRIYDKHSSINIQKNAGGISGSKIFEFILIPESADILKIAPFTFSYFNYSKNRYITLKTKEISIKVKPGKGGSRYLSPISQNPKSDVTLIGKDIRFIKEKISKIKNQGDYFYNNGFNWVLVFLTLSSLGFGFYYYKYNLKLKSDVIFAKSSRAYKLARKKLGQIEKNLSNNNLNEIPQLFEKMFTGYISDKFNIPTSNIVIEQIKKVLIKQKLEKNLINQIEELYHEMNILRYSPSQSNEDNYKDLLLKSNEIINHIEKKIKI